jgi:hypothetical protein
VNRENIQKVRDHIARLPPERFNMAYPCTPHGCDSAACIGGWTNFVVGGMGKGMFNAQRALDLPSPELFYPTYEGDTNPYDATCAQAVRVLDRLLETGEVDWSIIDEPAVAS